MESEKVYEPLIRIEEVLPILDKIAIFRGLSEKQLATLFKLLKKVSYGPGETVFEQHGQPSHIYIVESGSVKIVADVDGTTLELIVLTVGKCFGDTSVLGIQPHTASALAVEQTDLIVLSREALLSIFDIDKELFGVLVLNMAREACRRLYETDDILFHYVLGHTAASK